MPLKTVTPSSPGRRHLVTVNTGLITKTAPEKSLLLGPVKKNSGRNNTGRITVRHRGGGAKRQLRQIDFQRGKIDIPGKIMAIEYDPNRTALLALVYYPDGDKRYIILPAGLHVGATIVSSVSADIRPGNCLPLKKIPVGVPIHNLEITPGKGAQLVRSAGSQALIQAKEKVFTTVLMPSKELRLIRSTCRATIGQVASYEHRGRSLGKAGRRRHLGWRPEVRGVAMHPGAHPHGGGEGRSGIGMPSPKSPWGKHTLGKKTRRAKRYSNQYIVRDRRVK